MGFYDGATYGFIRNSVSDRMPKKCPVCGAKMALLYDGRTICSSPMCDTHEQRKKM